MVLALNDRNAFVSFLAVIILSFSVLSLVLILVVIPLPSFADRIVAIRQGTTLAVSCDLSNGNDSIYTAKAFSYEKPTKLTFNCERSGGDIDLKKGESVSLRCLHDNPLSIPKHAKIKAGELFYVLCNSK